MPLVAPPGHATRPTSDKLKAAIFSSLGDLGCEGRVLDLFAGTGGLGIEALSRGADWCDFVDSSATACRTVRANLEKTRLTDRAAVHSVAVERFIGNTGAKGPYDLILLDPPYAFQGLHELLMRIGAGALVVHGTALLVEHSSRTTLAPQIGHLTQDKTRTHGDSAFSLYLVLRPPKLT